MKNHLRYFEDIENLVSSHQLMRIAAADLRHDFPLIALQQIQPLLQQIPAFDSAAVILHRFSNRHIQLAPVHTVFHIQRRVKPADFPLNVSRSFLQNDGYVRRISNHITKKVADRLTGMFKTERETYEGFWPDIHPFIKYGVMRDEKFAERMKDCLLFKTTDGKFLTLAEYKERNGEKLPDKMVYTSDPARQDAAIRLFTERGIDVTVLDQPIDVNFVSYMEYSADPESKFRYCRVDAELDSLTSTEDAPTLDSEKLTELMREASGNKDLTVEVKPLVNDSVPVMLVEDEQTRRFNDMGRIYGHSEFTMPAKYSVVLNSRSRTIEKLAAREKDERSVLLARQLYDLAELSRQPLEAEQMTEFIRRSMEIVDIAAQM